MVAIDDWTGARVDRPRPPDSPISVLLLERDHRVLSDRVAMELAADDGEIMEVEASRKHLRGDGQENPAARAVGGVRGGNETVDLVGVSRAGDEERAPGAIDSEPGGVRHRPVSDAGNSPGGGEGHEKVLVFPRHEQRDAGFRKDPPPGSARVSMKEPAISLGRAVPETRGLGRMAPLRVMARPDPGSRLSADPRHETGCPASRESSYAP